MLLCMAGRRGTRGCLSHLTFSVITEAHLRLPKADGVFALANAIELLKLGLVDALCERVSAGGTCCIPGRISGLVCSLRHTWLGK